MLNSGGDFDYITGMQLTGRLAPFLVVATTAGDKQNLPAAFIGVVDVPIVAAAWLESYVADDNLVERKHVKIALAYEIFCISIVFRAVGNMVKNFSSVIVIAPLKIRIASCQASF